MATLHQVLGAEASFPYMYIALSQYDGNNLFPRWIANRQNV